MLGLTVRRVLVAAALGLVAVPAVAQAARPPGTALAVHLANDPAWARGSDGRLHVAYDLLMTNASEEDLTLRSIEILGPGRHRLGFMGPREVESRTHRVASSAATATVAESTTVATQIDLALHGQRPPARVTHRIRFRLPRDPTATEGPDDLQPTGNDVSITEALFPGRVVRGPVVRISRKRPMVIASPLAGAGWWNANGCCGETTPHRQFLLPTNGEWVQPERFAIDWVQLRNGRLAAGDGSRIDQYPCYGSPLLAVAPGRVVDVVRGYHDIPPHATPLLRRPSDFGGNQIYIRLRRGVYAMYAHIRPGSIRVHEGERVNRGEQIAELGNTGNTTAPHLHFALMDATKPLSANSLPFEIHHFHLQGTVTGALSPVRFKIHPTPRDLRDAHPLFPDVFDFGAAAAARPR